MPLVKKWKSLEIATDASDISRNNELEMTAAQLLNDER